MTRELQPGKLKAGVIGIGNMGRHHVRNYAEMGGVALVGIVDLDKKLGRQLAKKFSTRYYADYKEFFKNEKPDLVSVCVPTQLHLKIASEALESGSNVLVEKPIASNVDEAKALIKLAKEKGLVLSVGHIERFNPAVLKLKELIGKGSLGTIVSVMARRANAIPSRIKDANVIFDIGVHDIDLLNFLLDSSPEGVYASGGKAILRKLEDYADIFLEYPINNQGLAITGHIQVNWITPVKIRKLNVTGTKGYAVANLISQELFVFDTSYTTEFDDFEDYVGKFRESKSKKIAVKTKEPLLSELEDFVASIKNPERKSLAASPEEALKALRIATLATEKIRLKEDKLK
ncbi:MAG: Gfo/Idh/MocA family oxidoreductase [bacterium]|nr:Gfo/Idh/MocA family oxidoreductase [bacterium]